MSEADRGRLIVAIDLPDPGRARELVKELGSLGVAFKVGLELFLAGGPGLVADLSRNHRVFLDLKFHDIPNTVAAAVRRAASLGVWMTNIHAAGGRDMMTAAREALETGNDRPILVAVTVLTSMSDRDLSEIGMPGSAGDRVVSWASLAAGCGIDGVVCSPREIAAVKDAVVPGFLTVTPGVRPSGAAPNDQARVSTPGGAVEAGGDYLVVGRPITRADDPKSAAVAILEEMGALP